MWALQEGTRVAAKLEDGITPTAMERSQRGKRWIITAFESTPRHMPEIILISCHNCGGKLGFGELFRQRISQKGGNGRGGGGSPSTFWSCCFSNGTHVDSLFKFTGACWVNAWCVFSLSIPIPTPGFRMWVYIPSSQELRSLTVAFLRALMGY